MIDLVVSHVSTEHPWFQQARRGGPGSPYWDWFVWSEDEPTNLTDGVVFPGGQETVWSYDDVAKAWYFHRFYEFQADLNMANPEVRDEINRVMGYWLRLGVSGFRVDAAPFVIEEAPDESTAFDYLRELREFAQWRRGDVGLPGRGQRRPGRPAEVLRQR